MVISAVKTHKITHTDTDLIQVLDRYIKQLKEGSIVAITSKIVSICEGRILEVRGENEEKKRNEKQRLIEKHSQYFIPPEMNQYNVTLTIANHMLMASAGIDESNGNGFYVLWPENPQQSANQIRSYLKKKFNIKKLGIIITDSKTTILRWGVTGVCLSYSGFMPIKDLIGTPDLFGKNLRMTKVNIADGLAGAAVFVMGESQEQTPLAIIEDIPHIEFLDRDPSPDELDSLKIAPEDDLYGSFLQSAKWQKGGSK